MSVHLVFHVLRSRIERARTFPNRRVYIGIVETGAVVALLKDFCFSLGLLDFRVGFVFHKC